MGHRQDSQGVERVLVPLHYSVMDENEILKMSICEAVFDFSVLISQLLIFSHGQMMF